MTKPERHERVWYHGSPYELTELAAGSTITPNRDLARAFSHKPTLVSIDDDGAIRHNGTRAGILYRIDEPLAPGDVYPHPRSAMPDGLEWLTRRPLRPHRIGRTRIRERERIAEKEIGQMMQKHKGVASAKMGPARGDDKSKETH